MLLLIARAPPVVWCVMSMCVCVCVCMCMVGDTKRVYRRMHYHMALRIAARSLSLCLPPLRCEAKEPQRMSPRLDIFAANTISCSSVSLMIRSLAFARCMPGETRRYSTVNHRGWRGGRETTMVRNEHNLQRHTHTHTHHLLAQSVALPSAILATTYTRRHRAFSQPAFTPLYKQPHRIETAPHSHSTRPLRTVYPPRAT